MVHEFIRFAATIDLWSWRGIWRAFNAAWRIAGGR